jgi:hypothetical protein
LARSAFRSPLPNLNPLSLRALFFVGARACHCKSGSFENTVFTPHAVFPQTAAMRAIAETTAQTEAGHGHSPESHLASVNLTAVPFGAAVLLRGCRDRRAHKTRIVLNVAKPNGPVNRDFPRAKLLLSPLLFLGRVARPATSPSSRTRGKPEVGEVRDAGGRGCRREPGSRSFPKGTAARALGGLWAAIS